MQLLLDAGADINAKDVSGMTPLLRAMYKLEWDKINFLLIRRAYIDRRTLDGFERIISISPDSIFKEEMRKKILPFLVDGNTYQSSLLCDEQEKVHNVEAVENTKECLICTEEYDGNTIQPIPCYDDQKKLKHKEQLLCENCYGKIRVKNNKCPLCQGVLQ